MAQDFILPCIFSSILSVWYFTFMTNLNALEKLPLHVFTVLGRCFYSLLLSLPFELVLEIIIARMVVWVFVFLLAIDLLSVSSILSGFNHYLLADVVSLLFGALFVVFDAFFIFSAYRLSVKGQLVPRIVVEEEEQKKMLQSSSVAAGGLKFISR
jgi:hypothetical protein